MIAQQPAPLPPLPPQPPTVPDVPLPPGVASFPVPVSGIPRTAQELADLRSKRQELSDQLESAVSRRNAIAGRLRSATGTDRVGLEQRLQLLDHRILQLETDIATTGEQLAAVPAALRGRAGSLTQPRGGNDVRARGGVAVGILFTLLVLAPLALAAARNLWRRGSQPATRDPETAQRLMRLEAAVDTIAIEIERVSEGQRFLTRLLSEPNGAGRLEALPRVDADPVRAAAAAQTTELRVGSGESA